MWDEFFDVIVIGAGHAGCEAALAAARMGRRTLILVMSLDTVARMSCNPAIGGLAKGQIVREIDAMGGMMGRAIDETGIQFRILNRSKGPAVRAPRAQADKELYSVFMKRALESAENLVLRQDTVDEIVLEGKSVAGVRTALGMCYGARAVVVATGTFLRGKLHVGAAISTGGRFGEPASLELSASLERLDIELGRLKTGTPARVNARTIDKSVLEEQPGDDPPTPFSFLNDKIDRPNVPCWITGTNERTHEIIRANLGRAPLYTGQIQGTGPRYCPSIEDKVVRFAQRGRHQVFLEPEGLGTLEVYCNGISTSLPHDVQRAMVASIRGLERAEIMRFGYAIEYDFVRTHELTATLETKKIRGLFLAGQINGTSGYEEAAGQGLVAGVNAARAAGGESPLVLGRDEAFIGVLIDDLVTKCPTEPYRMFTSSAEYRLLLRADNADRRLTPRARELGLVDDERWRRFQEKCGRINELERTLSAKRAGTKTFLDLLRSPEISFERLARMDGDLERFSRWDQVVEQVEIEAKYAGYIVRQLQQVEKLRRLESKTIPAAMEYESIPELSKEARRRLSQVRPRTVGQAARIAGVRASDLAVLMVWMEGKHGRRRGKRPGPSSPAEGGSNGQGEEE